MNRQRRMEAIARRRAIIDNHLQMLASCNEARIPNIIRNRTPRSQIRPRYNHSLQVFRQFETVHVESANQQGPTNNGEEELAPSSTIEAHVQDNGEIFSQEQPSANANGVEDQVYVALVNDDNEAFNTTVESFMGQNQGDELVPVPAELRDEVMRMLAASGSNEQMGNPLQTFKTEDGTVMVVLEGNDVYNKQMEASASTEHQMEALTSTEHQLEVLASSEDQLEVSASTSENGHAETTALQQDLMIPVAPDDNLFMKTENLNEEITPLDSEQTYVILQDVHGRHILIPSSAYPQANAAEENIVEFIASEGAHIEQLMAVSKNSVISKTVTSQIKKPMQLKRRAPPMTKVSAAAPLPKTKIVSRHIQQRLGSTIFNNSGSDERPKSNLPIEKSKLLSNGQRMRMGTAKQISQHSAVPSEFKPTPRPIVEEEKPRPFRFELPEFEDNLDNFMSVPVPIQIGNIRSITETKDDTHTKKVAAQTVNTDQFKKSVKNLDEKLTETCEACEAEFRCRKMLVEHIEEMHQDLRLFKCEQCNQQYSFESSLINHTRNHHRQKKFQCGRCKKLFQAETTLISHQKYCGSEILNTDETSHNSSDTAKEVKLFQSETISTNGTSECTDVLENNQEEIFHNFSVEVCPQDTNLPNTTSHTHSLSESNLVTPTNKDIFQQDHSGPYCEDRYFNEEIEPPSKVAKLVVQNQNSECDLNVLSVCSEADAPTKTYSYTIVPNPQCSEIGNNASNNDFHVVIIESPSVPETVGRRTLNKATAKANMSNEVFTGTWESHISGENDFMEGTENEMAHAQNCDLDADSVSLRSAKIRARNIRTREMEGKEPNEEEIGVNFLNIFQQVVKQSST
ncbi:unnamed protein product [Orchesella dallaii]|uniref:C2H2-type domain-containing protein n=1 Tax=Orchesella dallaii TaxID=48710 RepID=A0ABP1QCR5_9HEXA